MKVRRTIFLAFALVGCSSEVPAAETVESLPQSSPATTVLPTNGYAWSYGDYILDSESMDYLPVDPEAIVLEDGRIRLFVDGIGKSQIRALTSKDGVNFEPESVQPIKGNLPSVVKLPDGRYRMYFVRFDPGAASPEEGRQIRSAISDDALNWIEEPGVRLLGSEPSAVVLSDGRTLLAVRRDSEQSLGNPIWCGKEPSAIWFAVSSDGLSFADETLVVDAATDELLEGRAYGIELARLADDSLVMHYEGCVQGFFATVDEASLQLGQPTRSNLRGKSIVDHFGLPEPDGLGGDISLVVVDGRDQVYISLRSTHDGTRHAGVEEGFDAVRQRIAVAIRK